MGLMPIHLHLWKLSRNFHLRAHSLPVNHIIKSVIEVRPSNNIKSHWFSLDKLILRQYAIIKSPIVNMDNRFNKIVLFFFPFNYEFSLRNRLINVFPNQFSFYPVNKKSNNFVKSRLTKLNNLILQASSNPQLAIIVTDASIKNQVTTSISYAYCHNILVIKILHHAVNVTTIKAKLFTIRCGINQAIYLFNIKKIFVVTDSIHTARRIFNSSSHLYQSQSAIILGELQEFFKRNNNNSIKFWNCSSNHK